MGSPDPTPYPELNIVLGELVASVQTILREQCIGVYLQGSFAVGDFDFDSDCDFIVVIDEPLSPDYVAVLDTMHERIYALDNAWAKHLEGSYFPRDTLRDYQLADQPIWYLDHGSRNLELSDHDNTAIVRCVLREHGIALSGPDPATFIAPIPIGALRHDIWKRMNAFRAWASADPSRISNCFYQAFAVLNLCRAVHDLYTGTVGSKRAGAEWVKANLDPAWTELIDRAWAGRVNPALSVTQAADLADVQSTVKFVDYIFGIGAQFADSVNPPVLR